jgi:hypothetical protein
LALGEPLHLEQRLRLERLLLVEQQVQLAVQLQRQDWCSLISGVFYEVIRLIDIIIFSGTSALVNSIIHQILFECSINNREISDML